MNQVALNIEFSGHKLFIVPSVHYRVAFARCVNNICRDPENRPEAIAVELGEYSAMMCMKWIRELIDENDGVIPGMLGLLKENNRISPSYREIAIKLQESTGKDLTELSQETLMKLLNYSQKSLLPISPTDSIIEAIRCAIELDVPLFGVDLEEFASRQHQDIKIEDPVDVVCENLERYYQNNIQSAESGRNEEIDSRREFVIAARLKTVLYKYNKVLYVGGIAHGRKLETLIRNVTIKPAKVWNVNEMKDDPTLAHNFVRCLVHPMIAIYFMDIFPSFTKFYNYLRLPPSKRFLKHSPDIITSRNLFKELIKESYENYFTDINTEVTASHINEDFQNRPLFEQYLANLCLVRQRLIPDLYILMQAGQSIMSIEFCKVLAKNAMDFPWARPENYPGLPLILPSSFQEGPFFRAEIAYLDKQQDADNEQERFYLSINPGQKNAPSTIDLPWSWDVKLPVTTFSEPGTEKSSLDRDARTWPPTDYLIVAMSLDARQAAQKKIKNTEEFQGSLMDGIDIKTTIRSYIRGDDKIYIQELKDFVSGYSTIDYAMDPVIWILDPYENDTLDSKWEAYNGTLSQMKKHLTDDQKLEELDYKYKNYLAALIWGKRQTSDTIASHKGVESTIYVKGMVYFIPAFFTEEQDAQFAKAGDYKRIPVYPDGKVEKSFFNEFLSNQGIDLRVTPWPVSMVRMAIPYARQEVTVIIPDDYILDPIVFSDAKKARVSLNIAPLSFFPANHIEKIRKNYAVYPLKGTGGNKYPASAEEFLKEKADTNRHLVPPLLLNYKKSKPIKSD